ncbi:trichohyalin-like isoform X2 [Synchiropus splendidus]|uniref:trichohyalin-like isoform X2 n=1 Tax=Synchiropus splendidus TaxID=270530 RepID=UPI00237E5BE7|nr:trichohyalin-like isoform X2 [Synchiropus splendidus]
MGRRLDLSGLTDQEAQHVLQVVQRDMRLRKTEEERLSELKQELDDEGSRCVLLSRQRCFNQRCCIRCCAPFTLLLNPRRQCCDCRYNVCKACRIYSKPDRAWICASCQKSRFLKTQSLEWFYSNVKRRFKRFGSAKVLKTLYRKHLVEHSALAELTEGSAYEESLYNEGSICGSDSTFYRQTEEHNMAETHSVALRVAEEAIEEAISNAEFQPASQEKQREALYLREHRQELVEELAKTIVQKIITRRKTLTRMREDFDQELSLDPDLPHHGSDNEEVGSFSRYRGSLWRSVSALSLMDPPAPTRMMSGNKSGDASLSTWTSVDRLDNSGSSSVLTSPDGNWMALQNAPLSRPGLLSKSKSQLYNALERESEVVSAYEVMDSGEESHPQQSRSWGAVLQEIHRRMTKSEPRDTDHGDLPPAAARRSVFDVFSDSEGNWKPDKSLLSLFQRKVPAEIRRTSSSRRTSVIDLNYNLDAAEERRPAAEAEVTRVWSSGSQEEPTSLWHESTKHSRHLCDSVTPDTLTSGASTPELRVDDLTEQADAQTEPEFTLLSEDTLGDEDDNDDDDDDEEGREDAAEEVQVEEPRSHEEVEMQVDEEEEEEEEEEDDYEEPDEGLDEEVEQRLYKLVAQSRLSYFSSTDDDLDAAGEIEGDAYLEERMDGDSEEEEEDVEEEEEFTFKLYQLEKELRVTQFSSTEDELDRVGMDEEERSEQLALRVCRLADQVSATQFSSTEDELDRLGQGEEPSEEQLLQTLWRLEEETAAQATQVRDLASLVSASQFSSTDDELDRVGENEGVKEEEEEEQIRRDSMEIDERMFELRGDDDVEDEEVGEAGEKAAGGRLQEEAVRERRDTEEEAEREETNGERGKTEEETQREGDRQNKVGVGRGENEEVVEGGNEGEAEGSKEEQDKYTKRKGKEGRRKQIEGSERCEEEVEAQLTCLEKDVKISEVDTVEDSGEEGGRRVKEESVEDARADEEDREDQMEEGRGPETEGHTKVEDERDEKEREKQRQAEEHGVGERRDLEDEELEKEREEELDAEKRGKMDVPSAGEGEENKSKGSFEKEDGMTEKTREKDLNGDKPKEESTRKEEEKKHVEAESREDDAGEESDEDEIDLMRGTTDEEMERQQEERDVRSERVESEREKEVKNEDGDEQLQKTEVRREMEESETELYQAWRTGDKEKEERGEVGMMEAKVDSGGKELDGERGEEDEGTDTKDGHLDGVREEKLQGEMIDRREIVKDEESRSHGENEGGETVMEVDGENGKENIDVVKVKDDGEKLEERVAENKEEDEVQGGDTKSNGGREEKGERVACAEGKMETVDRDGVMAGEEESQNEDDDDQPAGEKAIEGKDEKMTVDGENEKEKVDVVTEVKDDGEKLEEDLMKEVNNCWLVELEQDGEKERVNEKKVALEGENGEEDQKERQAMVRQEGCDGGRTLEAMAEPERASDRGREEMEGSREEDGGNEEVMNEKTVEPGREGVEAGGGRAGRESEDEEERMDGEDAGTEEMKDGWRGKREVKDDRERREAVKEMEELTEIDAEPGGREEMENNGERGKGKKKEGVVEKEVIKETTVEQGRGATEGGRGEEEGEDLKELDEGEVQPEKERMEELDEQNGEGWRAEEERERGEDGGKLSEGSWEEEERAGEEQEEEGPSTRPARSWESEGDDDDDEEFERAISCMLTMTLEDMQVREDGGMVEEGKEKSGSAAAEGRSPFLPAERSSAASLRRVTTEVLRVLNTTEDLLQDGAAPGPAPSLPPDADPRQLSQELCQLEEKVYVAAGAAFGLEAELADLEERARRVSGDTPHLELSFLEEQVASAAARVQQSELQISNISTRIAALRSAGLDVDPQWRLSRSRNIPVMVGVRARPDLRASQPQPLCLAAHRTGLVEAEEAAPSAAAQRATRSFCHQRGRAELTPPACLRWPH